MLPTDWKECPVFANHACPFKNAKDADEVTKIFSTMLPASHTDETRPTHAILIRTLAYFHRDIAMEEYSVIAIMSRLAQEHFQQQNGEPDSSPSTSKLQEIEEEEEDKKSSPQLDSAQASEQRLSEALKLGTEEAHKEAESVHFVKNFVRGKIDRGLYSLFVAQLFHVYNRLEKALEEHAPRCFADCYFPKENHTKIHQMNRLKF